MAHPASGKIQFGVFEFEPTSGELRKYGNRIRLQGQPLQLLLILLNRAGQIITREELKQALWQGSTFVDFEQGLNAAMNRLRQALGDSADRPRYIETVPRRGYRFIAPLQVIIPETPPATVPEPAISADDQTAPGIVADGPARRWKPVLVGAVALVISVVVLGAALVTGWMERARQLAELELQGSIYVGKWTAAEVRQGIEYYTKAVALKPTSATAHAGLAQGWTLLADLHSPPHEVMPKAKAAALTAVRLDDTLPEAHVMLGLVKMQYDWDWEGAEREFRRAIEVRPERNGLLNPSSAIDSSDGASHRLYGWLLTALGRFEEAYAAFQRPLQTNPARDFNLMELGLSYYFGHRFPDAIEQGRRAVALDPTSYWSHMMLGWAYEQQGRFSAAIDELKEARRLNDVPQVVASLGYAYAASGRTADARAILAELHELSKRRYVSPYDVAMVYAGLGDKENVLIWLEKAYDDRSGWLALWGKVDPKFNLVRTDPHFQDLLRRMGLTKS